jgi:hypothetical protein
MAEKLVEVRGQVAASGHFISIDACGPRGPLQALDPE